MSFLKVSPDAWVEETISGSEADESGENVNDVTLSDEGEQGMEDDVWAVWNDSVDEDASVPVVDA